MSGRINTAKSAFISLAQLYINSKRWSNKIMHFSKCLAGISEGVGIFIIYQGMYLGIGE